MGGAGSGSHYHWWRPGKKAVVEQCLSLDANRWMREGVLKEGVSRLGSWHWTYRSGGEVSLRYQVDTRDLARPSVRLSYSWVWQLTGEEASEDYAVRLTATRPRFGGLRWWFVCPLIVSARPCNRRVGKLYLPPRRRFFGCRHCHQLTYTSCQESRKHNGLYRLLAVNMGEDFATVKRLMQRRCRRRL